MGRWMAIKTRKQSQDARKGVSFAKLSKDIIVAAKMGGGDLNFNFRLRTAVDKAKAGGLSNDKIDNAIAKGTGAGGGEGFEEITYEGYGPGGVAIFIEATTDNRNRTAGDIRSYFNKCEGNLGQDGCVGWLFEPKGLITLNASDTLTLETLLEVAIECGAQDARHNEDTDEWQLVTEPSELNAVCQALEQQLTKLSISRAELIREPSNQAEVTDETIAKPLLKLLQLIDDHDDVQQVYSNEAMDDALLEANL